MGKLGNIDSTSKMYLTFLAKVFASWEANFVPATMFPEVGKQGNIDRKHNVSATLFPSLPRALRRHYNRRKYKKKHITPKNNTL